MCTMTRSDLISAMACRFPTLTAKDGEIAVKETLGAVGNYASLAPTSSQTLSTSAATSCRKELRSGDGVTSGPGAARS